MSINLNVGEIANTNVSLSGTGGSTSTTDDQGSILAVKYIKDDSSSTVSPEDLGTLGLKNWFAEYVGTLGKYNRQESDTTNIKWSDYQGATILGFRVQVKNETSSKYKNNNDAAIRIQPINGSQNSFAVKVGDITQNSTGNEITFTGFNSDTFYNINVSDTNTGVSINLSWKTGYVDGNSTLLGTQTVGGLERSYFVSWAPGDDKSTTFSNSLYFFLGKESTRSYGTSYS